MYHELASGKIYISRLLTHPWVFEQQAQETVGGGVEQFSRLFRGDYEKYARLMKGLKIRVN
jgi:hypothetical protein